MRTEKEIKELLDQLDKEMHVANLSEMTKELLVAAWVTRTHLLWVLHEKPRKNDFPPNKQTIKTEVGSRIWRGNI